MGKTAFVLGNGESRRDFNLHRLRPYGKVYGCNAIYRDFPEVDVLVSVDYKMIDEIRKSGWPGDFRHNRKSGWVSGPTACAEACKDGNTTIYMLGMDLYGLGQWVQDKVMAPGKALINNIYKNTEHYKGSDKHESGWKGWIRMFEEMFKTYPDVQFCRVGGSGPFPDKWQGHKIKFMSYEEFETIVLKQRYIIVSGYTPETLYEEEAKKLKASLEDHGLAYYIQQIPNSKQWVKNAQYKTKILLYALTNFQCPVVWVDADAIVERPPVLFDTINTDIAFYRVPMHRNIVASGTLFLNNTPGALNLVRAWDTLCNNSDDWDQRLLQKLLENEFKDKISTTLLPAEYCKIFDLNKQVVTNPVITHYQASRQGRREIK